MKKYLLFSYYGYYPAGGMKDFREGYENKEDLIEGIFKYLGSDYIDIYNVENEEIVNFFNTENITSKEEILEKIPENFYTEPFYDY